jgi:hypothetical protein
MLDWLFSTHLTQSDKLTNAINIFFQYDSHTWTADITGEYRACFSNEFSTFSHKVSILQTFFFVTGMEA